MSSLHLIAVLSALVVAPALADEFFTFGDYGDHGRDAAPHYGYGYCHRSKCSINSIQPCALVTIRFHTELQLLFTQTFSVASHR
ncbi:hypothetical protein QR680_011206 [Steinernema hermaphroditum]|uniref:Uncharacterized protein n=1 Tax=Steinernema hermaphroditum TaxID=289476 RepID=A0AA39IU84_9BILA|nr:hypothetical protein QR680_011206 [Steinernema hermaphroditum]